MAKTNRPSGLTISRSGGIFTAKWKIGDSNYSGGQACQYRYNAGTWAGRAVTPTATSNAITLSTSSFWPTAGKGKLTQLSYRVKGRATNKTDSDWSTAVFNLAKPNKPKVTATVGTWPRMTFAWTVATSNTDNKWFTDVQYRSILVKDSTETDGSKLDWTTSEAAMIYNTGGASGSINVTDDSSQLGDGHSYTRWFKVRARGPAGASAWTYAKHVYALPLQATITDYEVTANNSANGYTAQVWYTSPKNAARPIENIKVQYSKAVPDAGMVCPSGASWSDGATVIPKDTTGGASFSIDSLLSADQCLFVRVNTVYDGRTTYGSPVLVDVGKLSTPSGLSVVTDSTQYTATVTATNNSAVADSFLAIRYYTQTRPDGVDIGVIPHGQTSAVVQCTPWDSTDNIRFGVYAVVGDYTTYWVNPLMTSDVITTGGTVPAAPSNVSVSPTTIPGTIRVNWAWSWGSATSAEISWADHEDAWESTDEPSTYVISNMRASSWNISGLDTGVTWYVRVRLLAGEGNTLTYGAYSDIASIDLSSAPAIPVLTLSESVITAEGSVTATWAYSTTDGTGQAFAEVAEAVTSQGVTTYTTLERVETAQHVTISAADVGWNSGETHYIAVRVTSASGKMSDGWSAAVPVLVAEPLTCTITDTSLEDITIQYDDEGTTVSVTVTALTEMPLTATIEGAGGEGITTLIIERAAAYHVDQPDETSFNGYEGETVAIYTQTGEDEITITLDDLIGSLDDSAAYRLVATVQDEYGQSASDSIDFEVHWEHQAAIPDAYVQIDEEYMVAVMTPIAPTGAAATDVCDIYRLSADKPQLIYKGATFGEDYVDPFPTIGEHGGHRFVTRTAEGDYITEDNTFAWFDDAKTLEADYNLIEFGDGRVELRYNIDLSSDWQKDFKQTTYLGGSVQGDWNKAVTRSGNITAAVVAADDPELIESMRRLAAYPGICHIRTKDGSSFAADVQVSETYAQNTAHKIANFALKITRVDQQTLEGMTLAEWEELHEE